MKVGSSEIFENDQESVRRGILHGGVQGNPRTTDAACMDETGRADLD